MSIQAAAAQTIATLRNAESLEPVENNHHISPQVYFSWDADESEVNISATTEMGRLLEVVLDISGNPRWLTLNIGLGQGVIEAGDQVVLLAEIAGSIEDTVTFSMLSAQGAAPQDTILDSTINLMPKGRVHTLIHSVAADDMMAGADAYHTLVLRLPKHNHRLTLNDLELRILPRARGLRAVPRRLADFA